MNTEPDSIDNPLPLTTAVDAAADEPLAPVTPEPEPVAAPPNPPPPIAPVKRRRWGRWLAILFLLLIVAVGAWFGLTRRQENELVLAGQSALADEAWDAAATAFTQALDLRPAFFRGQVAQASLGRGIAYYHQDEHAAALTDLNLAATTDNTLAEPHAYISLIQFASKDYDASLDAFTEFGRESRTGALPDPILAQLHNGQAIIHYQKANPAPALTSIEIALAHDEHLTQEQVVLLYAYRAILNYQTGETETVLADGELALERPAILPQPIRALLRSYMALLLFDEGETETALAISKQALSERGELTDETLLALYTSRAEAYLETSSYLLAAEDANAALINVSRLTTEQQLELHLLRGQALFAQGFWVLASDSAQSALDIDDSLGLPYVWQAYAAFRAHDYETAYTLAETALEKDDTLALAYYVQGTVRVWQLNEEEGLPLLEQARTHAPDNPEILAMLLFTYYLQGDDAAAEETYAALSALEEETAPQLWGEAVVALQEDDYEAGLEKAGQAINLDNSRPEYYFTWAESSSYQTAYYTRTIAVYDKALALNPEFAPAIINRAWNRFDHYDLDGFLEAADWLIAHYPDNSQGYVMHVAYAQEFRHDLDEALDWAEQAVAAAPDAPSSLSARGFVKISLEQYEEAQADFEAALALDAENLNSLVGLSMIATENEDYEGALAYLDQGFAIYPNWIGGYLQKAFLYYWYLDDQERADDAIEAALALDPLYPPILATQGRFAAANGDFTIAEAKFKTILQITPNDYSTYAVLALIYLEQNDLGKTRGAVSTALNLNPRETDAIRVLMLIAYEDEDWAEVIERADQIIAINERNAEAYGYRGAAHSRSGEFTEAEADLNQAINLNPDEIPAYLELAYLYEIQDDYEAAIATLELALEQTDDLQVIAEVENRLAYLQSIPELVDGQRLFTDVVRGITLLYGDEWEQIPPDPEASIIFDLIRETSTGDYAFITIFAGDVPAGVTAQDIMDFLHEAYQESNPSYQQVSRQNTTVDGINAVLQVADSIRSDGQGGTYSFRVRHYVVVHNGSYFLIEYSVLPENYDELLDEFEALVDTIDLLP